MMQLIYSALKPGNENDGSTQSQEVRLRYHAYLAACAKHRDHITEIQKRFPSWKPRFR